MNSQTILPTLLRSFFEGYLVGQRDVSQNTIFAYRDSIKLLLRFAARLTGRQVIRLRLADLGIDTIRPFLDHLENEPKNCAATRNCRLVAIHRFLPMSLTSTRDMLTYVAGFWIFRSRRLYRDP